MVRAGNENELPALFEANGLVAIGWTDMGDLSVLTSRKDFKERYAEVYPEHSKHRRAVNAGQVFRFVREIDEGDYVLTYIKDSRELLIGHVNGDYAYRPDAIEGEYDNVRPVEWLTKVSRDAFTAPARNSMGSTLTVFSLDDYVSEIHRLVTGEGEPAEEMEEEAEEAPPFYDEVKSQADELIADIIHQLDPYDFQDLVAGVLRAMGFEALSTPPGPDRGIDIVAHPDAFGFEQPRIKAQVKHKQSKTGGPEMRSFLGTLRSGENGIYVSTGGFTKDAELEAEHAHEPVTLLDRDGFIQLLLKHYEELESEFKAQIPLRRVWVPAE
jgi:restriction system protein